MQFACPSPTSTNCSNWYAVYTWHQHEKAVATILSQKGFEIFLPLYIAAHRWRDRVKLVSLPLFPSYLFLRGGIDRWLQVLNTPGVCNIVGFRGRPAVIPQAEIESVRRIVESTLGVEPHPFLKCGDQVRIKSGPLEGVEGILVRKKNEFRLILSVELLERSVAAEVDVSVVERAASQNVKHIPRTGEESRLRAFEHSAICPVFGR